MTDEHNGKNGSSIEGLTPRAVDAAGRLIPISDEERRARLPLELASLRAAWDIPADETDTDEVWDEILKNLGVEVPPGVKIPAGRGLATWRGARIGRPS